MDADSFRQSRKEISPTKKTLTLSILLLMILAACKVSSLLPLTKTLPPNPEIAVLKEVLANNEGCMSDSGVESKENTYYFRCRNSADTGYSVTIARFSDEGLAHTQFNTDRGENLLLCFHGFDQYEETTKNPNNKYIVQERIGWQAGLWLVSINASFDYGYFHFTAREFSDAVYTSAIKIGLFQSKECPSSRDNWREPA
jgi:hypothetical protein